jgi:hypothetical protein
MNDELRTNNVHSFYSAWRAINEGHTHALASDQGHTHTQTLLHSNERRPAEPGGSAYGVGVVGRSLSGVARGQRALLEADDAEVHTVYVQRRSTHVTYYRTLLT